jgi:hypothetical protein
MENIIWTFNCVSAQNSPDTTSQSHSVVPPTPKLLVTEIDHYFTELIRINKSYIPHIATGFKSEFPVRWKFGRS